MEGDEREGVERVRAWVGRNRWQLFWVAFFVPYGYVSAGEIGAGGMALLFIGIPIVVWICTRMGDRFREWQAQETVVIDGEEYTIEDRTTLVRVDEPCGEELEMWCGGRMAIEAWRKAFVKKVEEPPGEAIQYTWAMFGQDFKIAAYMEIDEDGYVMYAGAREPDSSGWVPVDEERDLPDE